MLCPKCKIKAIVREVLEDKILWACRNPQCADFGKVIAEEPIENDDTETA